MSTPLLIDDSNPSVTYSPNWISELAFPPAVHHTRHGAALEGISVSLTFEGTGIDVVIALDPTKQGGRPTASYTIDGNHVETSTVPFAPPGLTQFNITAFSKTDLPMGSHVLNVTNMNGTSPNLFWIDYFLVYRYPPSTSVTSTPLTSATSPTGSFSETMPSYASTPISTQSDSASASSSTSSTDTESTSTSALVSTQLPSAPSSIPHTGIRTPDTSSSAPGPRTVVTTPYSSATGEPSQASNSVPVLSAPSDSADPPEPSHSTGHKNIVPAVVGGVLGGIVVVCALVALVLFIRRRNSARREVIDASNTASYFTTDGWVTLRSDCNASAQDVTADVARGDSALGYEGNWSDCHEYASASEHSRSGGPSEAGGFWHAL